MKELLAKLSRLINVDSIYPNSGEFVDWLTCKDCRGQEFYAGTLDGVAITVPTAFDASRKLAVQCTVCLSCGHVFNLIDEDDLEWLRAFKAERDAKSGVPSKVLSVQVVPDDPAVPQESAAADV